jgi:hypothetical protein
VARPLSRSGLEVRSRVRRFGVTAPCWKPAMRQPVASPRARARCLRC